MTNNVIEKGIKKPELFFYIASLAVLFIASVYLFKGGPESYAARSTKEFWNLGHIAYFFLLILLLGKLKYVADVPVKLQWSGLLLLTLALGTLIEVLQYNTERTPDIADIARDLSGCILVLCFNAYSNSKTRIRANLIKFFAAGILFVCMTPLVIALTDETIASNQFPVLSDFETPLEIDRWYGDALKEFVQLDPASDTHQMKVEFTTAHYSGAGMEYFPANWKEYDSVNLKLYYPYDDVLVITVRIHDLEHEVGVYKYEYYDRYNKTFQISKGWNEIKIPFEEVISAVKNRKMNLTQIQDISIFTTSLAQSKTIYLDKVYLQ